MESFERSSGRLAGAANWSDVGSGMCLSPNDDDSANAAGGSDYYFVSYETLPCDSVRRCALSAYDAGTGENWPRCDLDALLGGISADASHP
jgi:hypothetical protein